MSKVQVDAIEQQCGTTLTVGGGASKTVNVDATTVTVGRCGGTVTLASGATQSGFGASGAVDWVTTPQTGTVTAATGKGYFINTTSGVITVNLPAGAAGSIVAVADYTRTFGSNKCTITANGSEKIGGIEGSAELITDGQSATFVYVDGTEGWINVQETQTSQVGLTPFISATGGAITTSGDYKIHTFTAPGSFVVASAGNAAPCLGTGSNTFDYMVIGGGGSGGADYGGGGGAGGYRESAGTTNGSYTVSPLGSGVAALTLSPSTTYPITVGAGGASVTGGGNGSSTTSNAGNNSIFSSITSAGGGRGGSTVPSHPNSIGNGGPGGAGGGGSWDSPGGGSVFCGGTGNTPPVSPAQGTNGGTGRHFAPSYNSQGGGGGATAAGSNQSPGSPSGRAGGAGATSSINATPTVRAGGGGGGDSGAAGPGGGGVGGTAPNPGIGADGTVNTGGGGGGSLYSVATGAGGSGIVIIRYKYQ